MGRPSKGLAFSRMDSTPRNAAGFEPPTPPPVRLDQDTRKRIVAGVRKVMKRLHDKGLLREEPDYSATIADPDRLHRFIRAYDRNRAAAADLVVDRDGRPVLDDDAVLDCGVTLPQVERLLVTTCARKLFQAEAGPDTGMPAPTAKAEPPGGGRIKQLLGGRAGAQEPRRPSRQAEAAERKLDDLRPLLGFAWQLPLLRHYAYFLERPHIAELGRDLLLLRDPEALTTVASLEVAEIRAARATAGGQFREVLATAPGALANLAWMPPRHLPALQRALQDRLWHFLARERPFIEAVMGRDAAFMQEVGPVLAALPLETVHELDKLPLQRVRPLLNAFFSVFEDKSERLLGDPRFARAVLSTVIPSLAGGSMGNEDFVELAYLKLTALKGRLDSARGA